MSPKQNPPERLKSTVELLKGSVFRVRDPDAPNTFLLVDVTTDYCSCSLDSNPDDKHLKIAKEYSKLKDREETIWKRRF